MINNRIFLSVALSGKVSYEQKQAERQIVKIISWTKKTIRELVNQQQEGSFILSC